MRETIRLATTQAQVLVDITDAVRAVVSRSGIRDGLVHVYAQGATAAIMIQHGRADKRSASATGHLVDTRDNYICTSDNLTTITVSSFYAFPSLTDLSDLQMSVEEFSVLYKDELLKELREQVTISEQTFSSVVNADERHQALYDAFDRAVVQVAETIEDDHSITIHDGRPGFSINTTTTDFTGAVTLNGAEMPFRIPNPRCAP